MGSTIHSCHMSFHTLLFIKLVIIHNIFYRLNGTRFLLSTTTKPYRTGFSKLHLSPSNNQRIKYYCRSLMMLPVRAEVVGTLEAMLMLCLKDATSWDTPISFSKTLLWEIFQMFSRNQRQFYFSINM